MDKTILPGWLYQTARLTAASFLRREIRRVRREQEAYMQSEPHTVAPDETWEQLAPLLEDAMGQLGDQDRAAVVLRFFGGKSFVEVGTAAGVSENEAKKRVSHALVVLQFYPNQTDTVVPLMVKSLQDSDANVRRQAAALQRINSGAATN